MQIDDSLELLVQYEAEGHLHLNTVTEVMSRLVLLSYYPEKIVLPGSSEFSIILGRYGKPVMDKLMTHLCESLSGREAITDYAYVSGIPQAVQQDKEISKLLFAMYFTLWGDLRSKNMDSFPYVFERIGRSAALFTQMRGAKLLEYAGI